MENPGKRLLAICAAALANRERDMSERLPAG
jgi:hypothetical protein